VKRNRERAMVPPAEFRSYYGRPVLKAPVWEPWAIGGYFFLGGVAGGSALLAAGADLTGRPGLRRATRLVAAGATGLSMAALIRDLGKPARFMHMLRVVKPTSPMSIGTWLLSAFGSLATLAATGEVSALVPPPLTRAAGLGAGLLAPGLVTYTGVLIADTAVPVWHEAHRELPYMFGASALAASGGLAVAVSPGAEAAPARAVCLIGMAAEQAVEHTMRRRLGMLGEPLGQGRAGRLLTAARWTSRAGAALLAASAIRRRRALDVAGGLALAAGSLMTRLGYVHAGTASANDPRYTVVPQRSDVPAGDGGALSGVQAAQPGLDARRPDAAVGDHPRQTPERVERTEQRDAVARHGAD
jgi:polysulfide reductase-like protein